MCKYIYKVFIISDIKVDNRFITQHYTQKKSKLEKFSQ